MLNPQFWAEDGAIFFQQNLSLGFRGALQSYYAGFPYLLQRIIARAAVPFGLANAPAVYSVVAIGITAIASACFSLPHFRWVVRNDWSRVLFCVALVTLPQSQELVGIMTNVHWYLGIWVVLISLIDLPRSRAGLALILGAYVVCLFSAPIAIIAAPLWLGRLVRSWLTADRREGFTALFVLGVTVVALLGIRGGGTQLTTTFSRRALLHLISVRIVGEGMLGTHALLALWESRGSSVVYFLVALVALVLLGLSVAARFKNLLLLLICGYVLVGSVVIMLIGRGDWNQIGLRLDTALQFQGAGGRYFVLGLAMLYLAIFATIDRLPFETLKVASATTLLWGLLFVTAQTFILVPFTDLHWRGYAEQLAGKLAVGSHQPLLIPINPPGWAIPLDRNIAPEVVIPPQTAPGELLPGIEFSQTFVSGCMGLNEIDLFLANYSHQVASSVIVRVTDIATGQAVFEQAVPGVTIPNNDWRIFTFEPGPPSLGHRYSIALSAPEARPGDAITIWASTGDAYPGGIGAINRVPTGGDFMFRYGCAR